MDENNSSQSNGSAAHTRIRSRFPKAQPNIGPSSGLARIRRLSGHYTNENENITVVTTATTTTLVTKDALKESNKNSNDTASSENDLNNTQKPVQHDEPLHINIIEDFIQQQDDVTSTPQTQPQPPLSPALSTTSSIQSISTKFTKEHIMNIIKFKAMQKLKKIESDYLKEKRKNCRSVNDDIDRSKTKMKDLLYYIPKKNFMPKQNTIIENNLNESVATNTNLDNLDDNDSLIDDDSRSVNAPQLKFDEDGSIILNEESLFIKKMQAQPVYDSTIVENEINDNLTYNSYRKFHHTKKWSKKETIKFYKALSMIGTDFTMIQRLFLNRTRDEIKRKFKREERLNQALIDKLLSKTDPIDLSVFACDSDDSDDNEDKSKLKAKNINKENGNTVPANKKAKLKRMKKRAFVDSDEDVGDSHSNEKKIQQENSILDTINNVVDNVNILSDAVAEDSVLSVPQSPISQKQNESLIEISRCNTTPPPIELASPQIVIPVDDDKVLIDSIPNEALQKYHVIIEDAVDENSISVEETTNINNVLCVINDNEDDDEIELIFDLDTNMVEVGSGSGKKIKVEEEEEKETETMTNSEITHLDIDIDRESSKLVEFDNMNYTNIEYLQQQPSNHNFDSTPSSSYQNEAPNEDDVIILDLDSKKTVKCNSITSQTKLPVINVPTVITNNNEPVSEPVSHSEISITKCNNNNDSNTSLFKRPRQKYVPKTPDRSANTTTSTSKNENINNKT